MGDRSTPRTYPMLPIKQEEGTYTSMGDRNTPRTYPTLPIKQEEGTYTSMGDRNTPRTYPMLPIKQEEGTYSFHLPSFYTPLSSSDNYTNQHQCPFGGSTHQLVDVQQEQGCTYDYHHSGNIANYSNQYARPLMHASGNAANHNLCSLRSDDRINPEKQVLFSLNDFYHHDLHWLESSGANPCILPSSNYFMNDYIENANFADGHGLYHKRKHPEVTTRNHYTTSEPVYPNLSSTYIYLNSRKLQRMGSNGGIHSINANAFTLQGYIEADTSPVTANGLHGNAINSTYAINGQPQPGFSNTCCMLQPFQPSIVGRVEHPGFFSSNYSHGMSSYGGYLHPGTMESMNTHLQERPYVSFNRSSACMVHPSSLFNHHQHLPPVLDMQAHAYNQYTQVDATPYRQSLSNLQTSDAYPNRYLDSTSIIPGVNQSFDEEFLYSTFSEVSYLVNPEEEDYEDYDPSQDIDGWHHDALVDVDHMSYEELLALGEHIGHVNTGLSEDSILKNLHTSTRAPRLSLALSDTSSESADETCAICLDGYQTHEKIGNLDCGHSYHADCIKPWLLNKNLCPICKQPALGAL